MREALGEFLGILEYKVRHGSMTASDVRAMLDAILAGGGIRATVSDLAACDRIVMQVHPERQKAAQQEQEMAQMRNQLSAITGRLDQFISMLSAAQNPRAEKRRNNPCLRQ